MPRTRYLASLLGQESILVLFYSIKYSVVEKITDFFTYRIVFFISLINDIQIRYFIFVVTIFYKISCACEVTKLTKVQNSFSTKRETLFSKDRNFRVFLARIYLAESTCESLERN